MLGYLFKNVLCLWFLKKLDSQNASYTGVKLQTNTEALSKRTRQHHYHRKKRAKDGVARDVIAEGILVHHSNLKNYPKEILAPYEENGSGGEIPLTMNSSVC